LLPFVEMWEQDSVFFLQWEAPIHTGIIKCFGSNVQLILAGVLRYALTGDTPSPSRLVDAAR
jgi:hypothetical protein